MEGGRMWCRLCVRGSEKRYLKSSMYNRTFFRNMHINFSAIAITVHGNDTFFLLFRKNTIFPGNLLSTLSLGRSLYLFFANVTHGNARFVAAFVRNWQKKMKKKMMMISFVNGIIATWIINDDYNSLYIHFYSV